MCTATVSHDPIGTVVEEKITVSLNRDGSIEQLEIKGNLYVSVNDPASGCCRLKLRSSGANGISFQVSLFAFVCIKTISGSLDS